jgi:PAS domain S-box-containing protein
VLVVEDNPITRKMLRVALELGGYTVLDAGDGRAALEIAETQRPDLLVLDFILPDMDGLDLLAEARRRLAAEVPAVVVTGMVSHLDALRSRSGASTHFLAKPVEPSTLLNVVRAELARPRAPSAGRRILVVDDEALNRKLTTVRLELAGYEVETVSGGEEALVVARRNPPAAIVSDVMMPSMDGFSLCREARRDPALAGIPIVLVSSAYVDDADRNLARQMGANALVERTPDLADATAAISEALRGGPVAPVAPVDEAVFALHRERLQVQLDRQHSQNETLLRQAAIQATALSLMRGLSEVLAQPREVPEILGAVLAHCLDAAGLSTGLLYNTETGGDYRLQAHFGLPTDRKKDAEGFFGHPELLQGMGRTGLPVAFSTDTEGMDTATRDFVARLGHSSLLMLPFMVLGKTYGALVLASDDHDLTESAWIGFARTLALQFGQTVALGQSLKRLAESESRYRALMEQATDAISILDMDGTVLEANQQLETLLGLPRERIIGRTIASFSPLPPEQLPAMVAGFAASLAAGGGRQDNVVLRRGDGALVELDFALSVNEIDGEASVLSIGRDVTERNRDAAALREAQLRLAHLVTSSPAVLFSMHPSGDAFMLHWISSNVERMLGFTAEEALCEGWWWEHLHPDEADRVVADVAASLYDHGSLAHEYRFRHRDGAYRWVRAEIRLLRDDAGAPREAIGSWSDVTARKDAEVRLRDSAEEYRLLFDSNPHAMWVYDKDTLAFLAVNDAALRRYGYSRDEFLAMTVLEIRPPEEVAAFRREYKEAEAEYEATTYYSDHSFKHLKKDGTVLDVDIAATRLIFGGRAAWLLLATDVTEKQVLQSQLVEAQKMEAVGQLAGGIAHDFNNLLGVITGYTELLIRELPPGSRESKRAEEIAHASDRAAALTRQLLAFSRRQVLQPRVLDLNDVVADVEKMLRRLISANIQIVTVPARDLGCVRADAGQVEQVLMNLAINARDAMDGGGRLVIETGNVDLDDAGVRSNPGARAGQFVALTVSDSGHGMTADTMAHIFEPFFTTKENGKGTGLGLATVYGIVRQSGGTVTVSSEPGRGTTFKVYLPRVEDGVEKKQTAAPALAPGGTETVLVVEDAGALRTVIREILEDVGYTVRDADSPDSALAFVQSTRDPIHLVLTDMVMPRMSGQELARRIAAMKPETRVVFMSGYADQVAGEEGTLSPDTPFLQKPFTTDALLKVLRRALDAERNE